MSDEIAKLRREQTKRVMPLVGQLLDAWDLLDNSYKDEIREDAPSLAETLEAMMIAMEGDNK